MWLCREKWPYMSIVSEVSGISNSFGMRIGHFEKEDWLRRCLLNLVNVGACDIWNLVPSLSCDFETCVELHSFQYLPSVLHWEECADLSLYVLSCLGMFEYSKTCSFEAGDNWIHMLLSLSSLNFSLFTLLFLSFYFFHPHQYVLFESKLTAVTHSDFSRHFGTDIISCVNLPTNFWELLKFIFTWGKWVLGQVTPVKIRNIKMWIDFLLCFIRLRNINSCNLHIPFLGTLLITSYTLTVFTVVLTVRWCLDKHGLQRLTWSQASCLNLASITVDPELSHCYFACPEPKVPSTKIRLCLAALLWKVLLPPTRSYRGNSSSKSFVYCFMALPYFIYVICKYFLFPCT